MMFLSRARPGASLVIRLQRLIPGTASASAVVVSTLSPNDHTYRWVHMSRPEGKKLMKKKKKSDSYNLFGDKGTFTSIKSKSKNLAEERSDEDALVHNFDDINDVASHHADRAARKKRFITEKGRSFVDLVRILVRGGHGGHGSVSHIREPGDRNKRPDGADGGNGGQVVIVADDKTSSLNAVPLTTVGKKGGSGKGNKQLGANAKEKVVLVPPGTVVRVDDADSCEGGKEIVADLRTHGDRFVAIAGGMGGRGNTGGAKTTRVLDPEDERRFGTPGAEIRLELELKTIADVGLVGLPNAGKSTFLRAVSRAHPKVAPYPFTTLNPHLGTVEFDDHFRFSVADIPGLAIGAANNVGLGHSFLRHIERSTILVYLIDMSGQNGSMDAVRAYESLKAELEAYNPELGQRMSVVAANKMDTGSYAMEQFVKLKLKSTVPVVPLSSKTGKGITDITKVLRLLVAKDRSRKEKNTSSNGKSFMERMLDT